MVITRQWQSFITKFIMLKEINQVIQNDRTLLKKNAPLDVIAPKTMAYGHFLQVLFA